MHWVGHARRYRCERCGKQSRSARGLPGACTHKEPVVTRKGAEARAHGHTPWAAAAAQSGGATVIFCTRCGMYADGATRGLAKQCRGEGRPHWALRRIWEGRHPVKQVALVDHAPCAPPTGRVGIGWD